MTVIKLNQFGMVLTGREFGADVMKGLAEKFKAPVCLDFAGVESLGSSFGDEVVPPLALKQEMKIPIKNANDTVKAVLKDIAADAGIIIQWVES
jgi:hypothetical protein